MNDKQKELIGLLIDYYESGPCECRVLKMTDPNRVCRHCKVNNKLDGIPEEVYADTRKLVEIELKTVVYTIKTLTDPTFLPSVKEMVDSVNEYMAGFGFNELMGLETDGALGTISVSRTLNPAEEATVVNIIQDTLDESDLLKGKIKITGLEKVQT